MRLPAGSSSTSSPSAARRSASQSFASASSGVQANRLTPPRGSAPMRAAASRSAVSDGTAPPVPAISLDHARDPEGDREGEQEAAEWVLLEGAAAHVAEHGRVGGPDQAGDHVEGDEAAPRHLQHAAGERDDDAPARDEAADDDQVAAALLHLPVRPVHLFPPLALEEAVDEAVADRAPDPVGAVVAGDRSRGGEEDHEEEVEVAGRREDTGEDHRRLAGDERDDRVERSHEEEEV